MPVTEIMKSTQNHADPRSSHSALCHGCVGDTAQRHWCRCTTLCFVSCTRKKCMLVPCYISDSFYLFAHNSVIFVIFRFAYTKCAWGTLRKCHTECCQNCTRSKYVGTLLRHAYAKKSRTLREFDCVALSRHVWHHKQKTPKITFTCPQSNEKFPMPVFRR